MLSVRSIRHASSSKPSDRSDTLDHQPSARLWRRLLGIIALVVAGALALTVTQAVAASDTTAPSAPSGVKATYYGKVGVALSWSKVSASDLDHYNVYRSASKTVPTGAKATPVARAAATTLTVTDASVPAGSGYNYAVTAVDKTGNESKASSTISGTATDKAAPAQPSGLKAVGSANGITLTWTAVSGTPDLAGYLVSRASSSGGTYTKLTANPITAASFVDATAPASATSYYKVTSVDLSGNASSAATGSAARPASASQVPPAPAGLKATTPTTGGVLLTWTSNPAGTTTGYSVSRASSAAGPFTTLTSSPISGTSYNDTTAAAGTTVYYRVIASNSSGSSGPSALTVTVPKDTTAPATPSHLTATAAVKGITLSWTANTEADLAGYVVSSSSSSNGTYTVLTPQAFTATTFVDTAATVGSTTYYRVVAVDKAANASTPATANAVRPVDTTALPPAPAGVKASLASGGGVTITWTANASGITTGYQVSRSDSATGTFTVLTATAVTGTSYTDKTAPQGATAYYRVVAVNASGASTPSAASVAVPKDTTAPATPSSGSATVATTGGMTLSWKANTEPDLAGYTVQKRDSNGDYQPFLPAAGSTVAFTATTFTDASVTEGTTVYYRVRAIDTSGNLSGYTSITANNPNVAPAVPAGLKTSADAAHGVDLTWTANTDRDLAGYSVYRSTTSSGTYTLLTTVTAAAAGTPPKFIDTSAPKGTAVYYKLTAQDQVGNVSKQTSAVAGTSTTDPVAIPVNAKIITVGGASGQFPTVTAALASIPASNLELTEIDIAPGAYAESFEIDQSNVILKGTGTSPQDVVITDNKASGTADPAGGTYGTAGSATVYVSGKNVTLRNLSVINAFDEQAHPEITSQQAVALRVEGDRFTADTVRLIGNQDTLLADTPKPTTRIRQYYVNSYLEGSVDYVFGAATAVFDRDVFHSLDRGKSDNGAITAASTDTGSKYGFLIYNSKVVSDAAAGTVHLGRPWHPSADPKAIASVVYNNTWLPAAIATAQPWEDMATADSTGTKVNFTWQSARFDEYADLGPGAGVNANRPQLTASAGASASPAKYLAGSDGWAPMTPTSTAAPATPTGVTTAADSNVVNLAWDDATTADVVGWNVYRTDSTGVSTKIASGVTSPNYSDSTVTNGAAYSYEIAAVNRAGQESAHTAPVTVVVASAPLVSDITVDPAATANGTTVFNTIGDALTAAPAGTATNPTVITVAAGRYAEYLTLSKPGIVLVGATGNPADVVITGNRAAGTPIAGAPANPDGTPATYGTSGSATMVITGNSDQLRNLTVENAYKEGTYTNGQAVALRTVGDKLVFDNIRLLGNQDTLYANSPTTTTQSRDYFHNAYIEGDVDFLFGRATAVFDHSTLVALDHGTSPNGAVTAASTDKSQKYGFLITNSRITGTAPDGSQNLGRPWQPGITQPDGTSVKDDNAIAQVVVRDTWLGPVVSSTATWTNMVNSGVTTDWHSARFDEFDNSGPGATTTGDRPQLTAAQAADYTASKYLAGSDGWNPVINDSTDPAPAVVTGLAGSGDDTTATLSWKDNTESDVIGYRVYRATGAGADVTLDGSHQVQDALVVKPTLTDTGLTNGTAYTYVVTAVDAAGHESAGSAPVTVTVGPKPLVADSTVAADGSGDYTTVQAAINAAPTGTAAKPAVIFVKPGTYHEVVSITKPYLILKGTTGNAADVVITYDNANGTATGPTTCPAVTASTCGTSGSATVSITSPNVTVRDLTIANGFVAAKHPEIGNYNTQAVALKATADKQVYDNVRLLGVQDTLLADSAGNISADGTGYARQYYVNSFIEGNVDFVFGRADAVFDRDTFHATAHSGGTIFAPSTASKAKGYLVYNSRIVSDNDPGTFYLGRPWRAFADGAYADTSRGQTVLVDTWMNDGFDLTHPWTDFAPNVWSDGRFDEYKTSGPGATVNANRPQLSDASGATPTAWLAGTDGWNPVVAASADTAPAAPTGVTATAGDGKVALSWTENADADVVGYQVYRDGKAVGATVTRAGYTDSGLTNGTAVSYTVTALDAAGHESPASAAVTATPAQKIDATVAGDGSGTYASLQAAVDAAPANGPWVIKVSPGTYTGTTSITKSNITIEGATGNPGDVLLTNATATPTLTITGSSVTVQDVSVTNSNGGSNTPAVSMTGDKILFEDTALTGTDRTVWADVPTAGAVDRQMIDDSTITGATNIVLGRASLVIHGSTIIPTKTSGTVFIPSTTSVNGNGFLVIGSTIAPASGVSDIRLGGPYAQGTTTNTGASINSPQTIIRDSVLNAGIKSQPWQDFNGYKWTDARFAEYQNTGAGAGTSDLRPQLSPADSVNYTVSTWLGAATWYPAVTDPATPADVAAPATPADLAAVGTDSKITLNWTVDPDAASYRLYRSTTSAVAIGPGTLVKSGITIGSYLDSGLTNATAYSYALVAVDQAGNVSTAAKATATPADALPPAKPTGVKAGAGDSRVVLTWTANTEPDLAGYRVYRDGSTTASNGALLTSPTFTDSGLTNGTSYSYVVTAVDTAGNESSVSDAATATPAPGDSTAPAVPSGVSTTLGKGSVAVTWTAVGDSDLASYTVYRSTGGGAPTRVGTSTAAHYTDTTVSVGTTYSYTVTATDTAGNESSASSAQTATPIKVDVVVAADGSGDATTVQAGINLLADNADYTSQGYRTVLVEPGTYTGVVTSGNRYGVNLVGATSSAQDTVITAGGTGAVATVTLSGNQWSLKNLTVANTNGVTTAGAQATALQVKSGDKDVFDNARFLGDKQTLLVSTASATTFSRLYFRKSYIEGGADMVLGRAVTVFDHSTFHVLNRAGASMTDSSVDASSPYGFLITDSTILTDGNPGSIYLGRPYSTQGKAQVVVRNTVLGSAINNPQPWNGWDANTAWTAGRFFEYQNTGAGAAITNAATRPQFSDADAATFTAQKYLAGTDGWNPVG